MPFDMTPIEVETKPDVVTEPWRKVLLDAADYIEAHGWRRGSYGCDGGPRCVSGAVFSVGHEWWAEIIEQFKKRYGVCPSVWNDTIATSAAEVTAALRECAGQP